MSACEEKSLIAVAAPAPCAPQIELTSDRLFEGAKTLSIVHGGERYLLRITRQNKLILTK